ncbi:hypothetical protein GCK72_009466 [Caenorhabditis remanei]|uniref:Uncharacterized protein n=1 Tax=Caenorhabditis remanei TaxID=31234 RepID=A0A6A5H401_CAERE|nr:hypothetical protein GCK72_009466 [Caenorhabditis remanei]KAF1761212.1 hypothetical protein GCK72_009466 [Caenorhabditis remanei]
MLQRDERKTISDAIHIILSALVVGFYVIMAVLNHASVLHGIFLVIAVTETIVSFLYVFKITWLMHIHLFCQSVLLIIPVFLLYADLYFYHSVTHSTAFLKSYKMDAFLNFVSEPYSLILSIGLVTVWLWRLFLTRMVIVQQAAKKIIAASKESSLKSKMIKGQHNFLSDILNTTSVIMFLVMAYSTSSSNAYTLVRFAMFEVVFAVFRCPLLIEVQFMYQSVAFSFPCFLAAVYDINKLAGCDTKAFLDSYDLVNVIKYFQEDHTFQIHFLLMFWFVRLVDTYYTVIGLSTFRRVVYKLSRGIVNERLTSLIKELETKD